MKKIFLILVILITSIILLKIGCWIFQLNHELKQKEVRIACGRQMSELAQAIDQYVLLHGSLPMIKNTEELGKILATENLPASFIHSLELIPTFSQQKWKQSTPVRLLSCPVEKHDKVLHVLYSNGHDDFILSE